MTVHADEDTRKSAAAPTCLRRWPLFGGTLALFVVAILAAAVAGGPDFEAGVQEHRPPPAADVQATPLGAPAEPLPPEESPDRILLIIGVVLALLVVSVLVTLLIWVIRRLVASWRNRPPRRRDGAVIDVDVRGVDASVSPEPDAPAVRRGIAAARTVVQMHADPGDAIVAAWLGLEETAADSGVGRARSETQVEFTLRMLLRRPGIEEPARALLGLYENVRFGGRVASEDERSKAVQALALIDEGWR